VNIGTLTIGEGHPAALVAELGNAHNGDFRRATRLLDAAKEAGASAAKLQCYTPDELIALRGDGKPPAPWQNMTMRELYQKAMTPREWFAPLFGYAEAIGLPLFSSVFGLESLELLESLNCPAYKLAALDFGKLPPAFSSALLATKKPVIVSCAWVSAPWDVAYPVYAPPGYPQPEAKLSNVRKGYWGYSYHGTNPDVPALSVAYGARFVEVHLHLQDEPSELEANVSLNEHDFRYMVEQVRYIEAHQ
jgi:pseudaminic acid synthase